MDRPPGVFRDLLEMKMNTAIEPRPARRAARAGATALAGMGAMLALAACASGPPIPTASLDAASQAIVSAERSDAARHAAGELNQARTRLAAANVEVAGKRMVNAQQLADEARADAELASAKAGVAKARAANEELRRSTGTLVEEMQRNTGDTR